METFIQPKVTGYRQLTEQEAALMNEIKAQEAAMLGLIVKLRVTPELDQRWVSIGLTQIEQGSMALVRSVARPTPYAEQK
jgi:hypothetical protein